MSLVYNDNEPRGNFAVDIYAMNPHKPFMNHFNNSLYLSFILTNGTVLEKAQASKELVICERKMAFWKRHPSFDLSQVTQQMIEAKKKWNQDG